MLLTKLGERLLWLRAADYVARYRTTLIGVAGSAYTTLAQHAIATALRTHRKVRQAEHYSTSPIDVVHAILGVDAAAGRHLWLRLLTGSRIRELREEEPDSIVTALPTTRPGDIDTAASRLPFSLGVITNIHTAHLSLFGSKDMLAHEVSSLIASLPQSGYAILNADDPAVYDLRQQTKAQVILFGNSSPATVRLRRCERLSSFGLACEVALHNKIHELYLPHIVARQQLEAILAALATTVAAGGDVAAAIQQLRKVVPPPGQLRLLPGAGDSLILDDSYDATPESMLAALNTLDELSAPRSLGGSRHIHRRIAILGDIVDLGGATAEQHERIGQAAAQSAHVVVVVGEAMRAAGAQALRDGADVHHFDSSRDVGKWLASFLKSSDLVLVSGSRAMHMEETVHRLLANPEKDAHLLVSAAR